MSETDQCALYREEREPYPDYQAAYLIGDCDPYKSGYAATAFLFLFTKIYPERSLSFSLFLFSFLSLCFFVRVRDIRTRDRCKD